MLALVQVIFGFVLLFYGGKYLVRGGVSIASYFNISKLVVGVTVVSFGTSAPELIVSVKAALSGHPEFAVGNILGSNISNIALVLALAALIFPIPVNPNSVTSDWPVLMFSGILFYLFILSGNLDFYEGFIFVSLLIAFVLWSVIKSRRVNKVSTEQPEKPEYGLIISLGVIVLASAALVFGAELLVKGASVLARSMGVSERIISLTLIAFGTSVPELTTSVIAAFKKETDISVGNIIGSNIFNIFGILGITALVRSIPVAQVFQYDVFWVLGISLMLLIFMLPAKGGIIKRWKGAVLLLTYIVYIYFVFLV